MAVIMRVIVRAFWICIIILLAACERELVEVPQTQAAEAKLPSPTTMTSFPTEEVLATPLLKPSATEAPVKTPTPTSGPGGILGRRIVSESLSPNRRWEATVERIFRAGEERVILRVVLDLNDIEWVVEDIPYADMPPFGFPFPEPFYWTKDGRYLYYTHLSSGDGCFAGGGNRGFDFYRLDLFSGASMPIADGGTWMSLSPDEKYLATFAYASSGPEVWNLETGAIQTFELLVSQEEAGIEIDQKYIVWAPDSSSFIYVIAAGVCDVDRGLFNWVIRVDIETTTQEILLARDERALKPVAWTDSEGILVSDGAQMYWMDPVDGEVIPLK